MIRYKIKHKDLDGLSFDSYYGALFACYWVFSLITEEQYKDSMRTGKNKYVKSFRL